MYNVVVAQASFFFRDQKHNISSITLFFFDLYYNGPIKSILGTSKKTF